MHYTIDFLDRQQWEQNRSGFEAKENSIVFFNYFKPQIILTVL